MWQPRRVQKVACCSMPPYPLAFLLCLPWCSLSLWLGEELTKAFCLAPCHGYRVFILSFVTKTVCTFPLSFLGAFIRNQLCTCEDWFLDTSSTDTVLCVHLRWTVQCLKLFGELWNCMIWPPTHTHNLALPKCFYCLPPYIKYHENIPLSVIHTAVTFKFLTWFKLYPNDYTHIVCSLERRYGKILHRFRQLWSTFLICTQIHAEILRKLCCIEISLKGRAAQWNRGLESMKFQCSGCMYRWIIYF